MFEVGGAGLELLSTEGTRRASIGCDISLAVRNVWNAWELMKDEKIVLEVLHANSWGDTSFTIIDPEGFKITLFTKH